MHQQMKMCQQNKCSRKSPPWRSIVGPTFSYHNIDHKWVTYLYGNSEPCFKRLYHQTYDCETHEIWQFTTPFLFLGNGVEWNGVVKLKVFLRLMKIYGQ